MNAINLYGYLELAVDNNDHEVLKILVDSIDDAHIICSKILEYTIINGHSDIFKSLISKGANVHFGNEYLLKTAIECCFIEEPKRLEIVKTILGHDKNIHTNDWLALNIAKTYNCISVIEYIESLS